MHHKVRVFMHLKWREKLFLAEGLAVVVAIRLGLWLLPFKKLKAWVSKIGQRHSHSRRSDLMSVER
ncbi:MAG: hypothetical protein V2I51_01870, partial [Anderseniella sp.]|nr:hypothetical protein [Anderseniella sp.]